jgi:hypothetical protein
MDEAAKDAADYIERSARATAGKNEVKVARNLTEYGGTVKVVMFGDQVSIDASKKEFQTMVVGIVNYIESK